MNVDRSLFLSLVASISGCERAPPVVAPATPAASPSPSASASSSPVDAGASPPKAGDAGGGAAVDTGPYERSAERAGQCIRLEPESEDHPKPHALPPYAYACFNLTVPAGVTSYCEGSIFCSGWMQRLTPQSGRRAMTCLQARSGKKEICEPNVDARCVESAVRLAKPRDDAEPICREIAARCAPASRDALVGDCQRAVASLKECGTLSVVLACLQERCSLRSCLEEAVP